MRIVIDPGHGGSDPGTINNGLQEKDITLSVALALGNLLTANGYQVIYTRTTDTFISLLERSQVAQRANADLFISIHVNSGGGQGVETYYSITDRNPEFASVVCSEISALGFRNRGAKTRTGNNGDYYSVIRETVRLSNATPYLIEMLFLDSSTDVNLYRQVGNQGLANAIYKAISAVYSPTTGDINDNVYVVKAGDTLYSIAQQFDTTIQQIINLNGLKSEIIYIGQTLQLPGMQDQSFYTVRLGDTLYRIANQFNTTANEIKALNGLSSDIIFVGQSLKIPTNTMSSSYTVSAGDTLYAIATQYGISVETLKQANNLSTDILSIGQILTIPSRTHTVVAGDTLYGIAQRYNTTVERLKTTNNLSSDVLSIGTQLIIT